MSKSIGKALGAGSNVTLGSNVEKDITNYLNQYNATNYSQPQQEDSILLNALKEQAPDIFAKEELNQKIEHLREQAKYNPVLQQQLSSALIEALKKFGEASNQQSQKRTVYNALTGFKQENMKWFDNNPEKQNINLIPGNYQESQLENDCLQSDRYNEFLEHIKNIEGKGFADENIDQPTHTGISQSWYDSYRDKHPLIATNYPANLATLTQSQIDNLYCQGFYKPQHIETVNNHDFAKHLFDLVVNHNAVKTAAPWVQKSINNITGSNISTQGGIGSETISAINHLNDEQLRQVNNQIIERRLDHINKAPKLQPYHNGLSSRAKSYWQK